MTGVVKSNRCGTCRDRKVKCDEVKPVCGPCQKGKRICKDPISKVKFARPKGISASVACKAQGLIEPLSQISIVRSVSTSDGGAFQTMRIGRRSKPPKGPAKPHAKHHFPISRQPSLSPIDLLQFALMQSSCLDNMGFRMPTVAGYMKNIPQMLGQSACFDDSIACLVNCHDLVIHGQRPADDLKQGNMYAKALISLQAALTDPVESYSDLTLGAVTILGNVEVFGGGSSIPQHVSHAGGACKLIEMRGPCHSQSKFAKTLYMAQRGQSITVAMLRNEACFFNEPKWRELSYVDVYDNETDIVVDELLREMTALPALLVMIRAYYFSPDETMSKSIYQEALRLRESLSMVTEFVSQALEKGCDIVEEPRTLDGTASPTVYRFSSVDLAHACTFSWGISIIINTIIARFLPADTPTSVLGDLQDQCILARQRICMSCEYAHQFRPFGAMYLAGPLIMAYRGATVEEKTWIMHQLWQFGELMAEPEVVWGAISLEYASKFFYGEPILPPS